MEFLKYNSDLSYSYVFGAFGTIELLNNKANECISVIVDPSFITNDAFKKINEICDNKHIPLIIDLKTISKIRDKGNIFVIGVFKKYLNNLTSKAKVLLYQINDVGIIGTTLRSMRGFNLNNLILVDCDVDLYHEHLIRSSMGAFFQCNIKQYKNINEYLKEYPNQNYYLISNDGNDLKTIIKDDNTTLIFTNSTLDFTNLTKIKLNKDIALDNLINIVLFAYDAKK